MTLAKLARHAREYDRKVRPTLGQALRAASIVRDVTATADHASGIIHRTHETVSVLRRVSTEGFDEGHYRYLVRHLFWRGERGIVDLIGNSGE